MGELKVFKIRFINTGILSMAVVLAETIQEAETLLKKEYEDYGIKIDIEEYEEVDEKGVTLTWTQPLKFHSNT